jgi:type III restriction enzyme
MSDFSLMDAIECGIVKLPRVPIADDIPGTEMPLYRNLWEHIRKDMPKKGRGKAAALDPLKLPTPLLTALEALYGHYKQTYELWQQAGIVVPPCFIIVCNNTATSKLVYDYVSGFDRASDDGTSKLEFGRLELFRNHDEHGNWLARPRTLLIDSEQLESGEALDDNFRAVAEPEIERFKREIIERSGNVQAAEGISDQDLLREVMNTVGKPGRLGESIRCVVSVSMLTEGWDTNTVTHVLGVRAFGTQLLCEQVIGRALRRQSYELNGEGLFNVEYADVLGIPFDFNADAVLRHSAGGQALGFRERSAHRRLVGLQQPRVAAHQGLQRHRLRRTEGQVRAASPAAAFTRVMQVHAVGQSAIEHRAEVFALHLAAQAQRLGGLAAPLAGTSVLRVVVVGLLVVGPGRGVVGHVGHGQHGSLSFNDGSCNHRACPRGERDAARGLRTGQAQVRRQIG